MTTKSTKLPVKNIIINPDDSIDLVVNSKISAKNLAKVKELDKRFNNPRVKKKVYYLHARGSNFNLPIKYDNLDSLEEAKRLAKEVLSKYDIRVVEIRLKGEGIVDEVHRNSARTLPSRIIKFSR